MTQTDGARLMNGPETARSTLLLAHGAGAPMDSSWMETVADGLGACGIRVVRFEPLHAEAASWVDVVGRIDFPSSSMPTARR